MSRILVIRFSAIGDVAMTIPVVYSLARQHPEHEITVLSRSFLSPLFRTAPPNIRFLGIDLKRDYNGFGGLSRLFAELKAMDFDCVADLHDVLRSQYLRFRFRLAGLPVARIDKGKCGKRKLVRRYFKVFRQQESSFVRYEKVFEQLSFRFRTDFISVFQEEKADFSAIERMTGEKGDQKWLGIAPFAKHQGKIYPLHLQEQVVDHFAQKAGIKVFLFGGGEKEEALFTSWTEKHPGSVYRFKGLDLHSELILMSRLDAMVSMDSANMHLASLAGTPVVSVWGATHPFAGFMGWNQNPGNTVQTELYCRPCSVFGQKPCYRGDYACLNSIRPQSVICRTEQILFPTSGQA